MKEWWCYSSLGRVFWNRCTAFCCSSCVFLLQISVGEGNTLRKMDRSPCRVVVASPRRGTNNRNNKSSAAPHGGRHNLGIVARAVVHYNSLPLNRSCKEWSRKANNVFARRRLEGTTFLLPPSLRLRQIINTRTRDSDAFSLLMYLY